MEHKHYQWDFIELYFYMGLTYKDSKSALGSRHGFNMSMSKFHKLELLKCNLPQVLQILCKKKPDKQNLNKRRLFYYF